MANELSERFPYSLSDLPEPQPFDDPFQRAALRQRRAVLHRSETDGFEPPASALASLGAGLLPGSGYADGFGYMPDFEGGFEPSLGENLRRGNYITAALQGLGVVGDTVQVVPYLGTTVGTGLKLPRAIQRAARASAGARRLAGKPHIFDRGLRRAEGEVLQVDLPRASQGDVVSDELTRLFATEGLEDKMLAYIEKGRNLGATNWYNTEPIRQLFMKELGDDEGEKAFRKYVGYVAAASAASDVGPNVRNASHYYGRDVRGEGLPGIGDPMPEGYGHPQQRNHQIFARKEHDNELDPLIYQKLVSFRENLLGNYNPVTVDRHALRLPAMLAGDANFLKPRYKELLEARKISMDQLVNMPGAWRMPTVKEYAGIEQFYKRLAQKTNLKPAEAQAAAWVGGAEKTGVRDNGLLSFLEHFEDRVHFTAKKKKISVEEVLRQFARGKIDLVLLERQNTAVG